MERSKLGRYEILEEIGRGAMGVVYKAFDPVLGRTVAIKTIGMSRDPTERAEYEARFYQEAKAAGGLAHPNIVVVYDVGNSGNAAYMAMEFLEGEELGRHFGAGRTAPANRAVEIAMHIAAGLAYAHQRGVIHRDIKPANIMVLGDGTVKITDFGIARMRSSDVKTQTGMLLGSPRYMSPEVFLGKRADARSDIFSLGIILYELVTGVAPFSGDSVSALMYQTVNCVAPSPSTVRGSLPRMLDFIIAKMLAKEPDERYQTANDLMEDLRACLGELRQGSGDAAANHPASPVVPNAIREPPLEDTVPLAVARDAAKESVVPTPTLGISRAFDSLAATHRLAARTGMEGEMAKTMKLEKLSVSRLMHAPAPTRARERWSRREVMIFAAGIGIAIALAGAIAAL